MNTSLFELFKIGIGPSSSHTVGPMRAALRFVRELQTGALLDRTTTVKAELYGSLAHTGIGHSTDRAILLGLSGEAPDTVDPASIDTLVAGILKESTLRLGGTHSIVFHSANDLLLHRDAMYPPNADPAASHPNGMRFTAYDAANQQLAQKTFYSVGGGFIVSAAELAPDPTESQLPARNVPYPFRSAEALLELAEANGLSIAEIILANESGLLVAERSNPALPKITRPGIDPASLTAPAQEIRKGILALWQAMHDCVTRGIATGGILPGGLNVRRRAPRLFERIQALDANAATSGKLRDPLAPLDWVSLFAIAVNEENAAGSRVVTAPTNGAAGVIPAIAKYYAQFIANDLSVEAREEGLIRFFLTAAAIGILYKENASISGAEVGCQGEVGVACSMAAGGLVAALGGSNEQVEHAAEIAMEHNLGMTCDPIGGLVQIPCIERNAMGAVKAVNACRMAMHETEGHKLSLDQVIETMYRTGMDMQSRYKETSLAGLALNIIEC
jgi:L-serine dehydratase